MLDATKVKEAVTKPDPKVIIVHESVLKAIVTDAVTYIMVVGVIGTGWLLGSSAMEWIGFLALLITAFLVALGKSDKQMTIKEAREFLNKLENKNGG